MATEASRHQSMTARINGSEWSGEVPVRLTLADFLRDELGLTGTHLGCEHGVCGACTVLLDGQTVRACLMFAVQTDGREVTTIEGLADEGSGTPHPIQQAFSEKHGLQCGFCTPGFIMSVEALLREKAVLDDRSLREYLSGNLCRCTGYTKILEAVRAAGVAAPMASDANSESEV